MVTKKDNQAGVTLLLAVLIMSTLAIISIAVGYFALQEIRASRAVTLTEPAIRAAETGGEQGLWAIYRSNPAIPNCPGKISGTLGNNAAFDVCKAYDAATFTLEAGVPKAIYIYNPDNLNGDIDLSSFPVTLITITNESPGFSVSANIIRLDGTAVDSALVAPLTFEDISTPLVPETTPETEGRMRLELSSIGPATVTVTTNLGMPDFPTIDSVGCIAKGTIANCSITTKEEYIRRIKVTAPKN